MPTEMCEVCGSLATCQVNDLRVTGWQFGADGDRWKTYTVDSAHLFCDDHARKSRVIDLMVAR